MVAHRRSARLRRPRDANWDVYLRSADGLGLARLTDDPALDTQPTWAADGRSVVFLSDRGNRWDLYRVAAEAGPADRLTDHVRREDNPSLAPTAAGWPSLTAGAVRRLDPDPRPRPGDRPPLPRAADGDRDPAWSPDGRSIAFVSRRPAPCSIRPGP